MIFQKYLIDEINFINNDVFWLKVKPASGGKIFSFQPGQFVSLKDSKSGKAQQGHFFSIASSPDETNYIELCIKIIGFWTRSLARKKPGDEIMLSGPWGKFIWSDQIKKAVFLAGGVGITPFLSMFRHIHEKRLESSILLLYGNRTPDSIIFKNELDFLIKKPFGKIVHILSDVVDDHAGQSYKGFITADIIKKETEPVKKSTFFVCGPPVFVQKMRKTLMGMSVNPANIRQELFT